jgi:uncharacterized protein (TIGR02285 family)
MFSFVNGRAPTRAQDLGQNELDGMLRLLIQRLPQYRHEFVVAETARFEVMARAGEPVCSNLLLKTPERLQWLYFTHSHVPLQSRQIHVVTRPELLPRFEGLGQPLELSALLRRNDLHGLLERDRSYGARIDALLHSQGQALLDTALRRHGPNLLRMLRAGRMDYTLDYGLTVEDFNHAQPSATQLVALPLASASATERATLGCARNEAGRARIEAIDAAVRQLARERRRLDWMRSWMGQLPSTQDQQRLRRYLDERARGGPQIE